MTEFKAQSTLESMVGKSYLINGTQHKFLRFDIFAQLVKVVTDYCDFTIELSLVEKFIDDMLYVEEGNETDVKAKVRPKAIDLSAIELIAMETIKALQENSDYVTQANAINKQVNSIISIKKLEIEIKKI